MKRFATSVLLSTVLVSASLPALAQDWAFGNGYPTLAAGGFVFGPGAPSPFYCQTGEWRAVADDAGQLVWVHTGDARWCEGVNVNDDPLFSQSSGDGPGGGTEGMGESNETTE